MQTGTDLIVASAIFFYRAGKFAGHSDVLWTALSILISIVALWLK
jgi:hypothetical protein